MQERIEEIKALYIEAADYNQAMNRASGRISAMKAELDEQIQSFDLKESIIDIASRDGDTQLLINELERQQQLTHTLETLTSNEQETLSTIGWRIKAAYRKPEALLRTLVHEVVTDDIDTDKVELILNELGEYLKPNQIECLNEALLEPVPSGS